MSTKKWERLQYTQSTYNNKTIAENEGISQKDLSDICYKRPATITTMIQKMEHQGFIKRVQDEKDKRL